jgi:hypothetical protein
MSEPARIIEHMTTIAPFETATEVGGLLSEVLSPVTDPASLTGMSDDALLAMVREIERLGRMTDGARVLVAGEVADRSRPELGVDRLSARLGCRTAGEVIERAALVHGQTARGRLRLAERLRPSFSLSGGLLPEPFPAVRDALSTGTLSTDAASAIVAELGPVLDRGALVDAVNGTDAVRAAEAELVAAAAGGEPADGVRMMAQTWALFLDPDGALPDDARGLRERGLTLGRQHHGTVPLRGSLLPEVAAQLQRLLDAYLNPKVTDGPRFEPDPGDGSTSVDQTGAFHDDAARRTSAQKRHDAFAGILAVTAASDGVPQLGGAAPTLIVAATPGELDRHDGVAFLQGGAQDAGAVSSAVARHIGCSGSVQRLILGPDGRILELGGPQRVFTGQQRRAITVRDGECIIPGCHVPAAWCEIHHVIEHHRGGPTHVDNGVPVCWFHHRTLETSGWEIEMRRGVPWVRPPGWIDPYRRWRPAERSGLRAWLARGRTSGGSAADP